MATFAIVFFSARICWTTSSTSSPICASFSSRFFTFWILSGHFCESRMMLLTSWTLMRCFFATLSHGQNSFWLKRTISRISSWASSLRCRLRNFLLALCSAWSSALISNSLSPSGLSAGRECLSPLRLLMFAALGCYSGARSTTSFTLSVIFIRNAVTAIPHTLSSSTFSAKGSTLVSSRSF